jgi:hypothetical protein
VPRASQRCKSSAARIQHLLRRGPAAPGVAHGIPHQVADLRPIVGVGIEHQHHSALDRGAHALGIQV